MQMFFFCYFSSKLLIGLLARELTILCIQSVKNCQKSWGNFIIQLNQNVKIYRLFHSSVTSLNNQMNDRNFVRVEMNSGVNFQYDNDDEKLNLVD
jgi:hypothetical protein